MGICVIDEIVEGDEEALNPTRCKPKMDFTRQAQLNRLLDAELEEMAKFRRDPVEGRGSLRKAGGERLPRRSRPVAVTGNFIAAREATANTIAAHERLEFAKGLLQDSKRELRRKGMSVDPAELEAMEENIEKCKREVQ